MKTDTAPKTDVYEQNVIRTLLANLIGDKNKIALMGEYKIEPEMLPDDMEFERTVLELIYQYSQSPNRTTLLTHLLLDGKYKDAEERLDKILSARTEDGAVAALAMPLHNWAQKRAFAKALKSAQDAVNSGIVDNHEIYQQITSLVMKVRPAARYEISALTSQERYMRWKERQILRASGDKKASGPQWPLPTLNMLVPVFRPSDMTIITAQTKHGKSTLGSMFAESFAWKQGYDVVVYQFETDHESFQERQIARHLSIPIAYQRIPKLVDPSCAEAKAYMANGQRTSFKALFDLWEKNLSEWEANGSIIYQHVPEWTVDELALDIEVLRDRSKERGRNLVIIIDHLSAMPKPPAKEERVALDKLYEGIKKIPERFSESDYPIYMIVLDQEKREEGRSLGSTPEEVMKNLDRVRTRGTSMGIIRAQVHLSLQRSLATTDAPVHITSPAGQKIQAVNAVGIPRYYHRANTLGPSRLFVVHANDGSTGWVDLSIENELFKISEAPTQSCPMIEERRREEEAMLKNFGLA